MSRSLIQKYLNELSDLRRLSGSRRESVVREAFKDLLKGLGRARDLVFLPEHEVVTPKGERRYVDGALVDAVRIPFGYWEAKDEDDDLDAEIAKKFARGYPKDNIIFEDGHTAVLIQRGQERVRCAVDDPTALGRLLDAFFAFERPEITEFRKAVKQFQADLPAVLGALRDMIDEQYAGNAAFRAAADAFLKQGKETINPALSEADVREMLIQHILTEEIFARVFGESDFHRHNNVAKHLYALEGKFFTGNVKWQTLKGLEPYYAAIRAAAAQIAGHHEKQKFLKVIYENFYKVYNPKAADRLGVVYTPGEIVRFMIEGADHLCREHFDKGLIDEGVEILDPATGTGTFVTELIEYFRGQPDKLKHKYLEELHANEVAILPYYVANLNIEATYAAIAGEYLEYPNLCFVDTLDNVAALRAAKGGQDDLFGAVSEENVERIKRQNGRKISVVIGNPPYRANQNDANENNQNRKYPDVDQRIKQTYVKFSKTHKTRNYDMFIRFIRWATDRLNENGIVCFITNRRYIDKQDSDGLRLSLAKDFASIYIFDLGGDIRNANRALSNNVFGITVGVAICFLVKNSSSKFSYAKYFDLTTGTANEKISKLAQIKFGEINFLNLDWISRKSNYNTTVNGFDTWVPIINTKLSIVTPNSNLESIFSLGSAGTVPNRDRWVYDYDKDNLINKLNFYVKIYNQVCDAYRDNLGTNVEDILDYRIKWTEDLKRRLITGKKLVVDNSNIITSYFRPFCKIYYMYSKDFNWSLYQQPSFYPHNNLQKNYTIYFSDRGARSTFSVLAINTVAELHFCSTYDGFQSASFYRYVDNTQIENISNRVFERYAYHYKEHYPNMTKKDLFNYVYAVLHDPLYRAAYAENLKRAFPRIPFHEDFGRWAAWGEALMRLHLDYETVDPWPLKRVDVAGGSGSPRVVLKALKETGVIVLDGETQLSGVPPEAWGYVLGNRTAIEWVLDQHKEKTPKDPTIREKFNTYRFADHKERVIDLVGRVVRVSVETVRITQAMQALPRAPGGASAKAAPQTAV